MFNNIFKNIKIRIYQLLLKSQKYTKTDMIYLAKGSFWMTFGESINIFSGILIAIVFANLLNPQIYGTYQYINSFIAIFSILTWGGLGSALTCAVAKGYEGTVKLVLKTRMKWGALSGVASLVVASYYYFHDNFNFAIGFVIIAIFLPFLRAVDIWAPILTGKKEFKNLNKYKAISNITTVLVMAITLFLTNNLLILVAVNIGSMALINYLILRLVLKKYQLNDKEDSGAVNYGKQLTLMGLISPIAKKLDTILMFHFLGPISVAIYSFAQAPAENLLGAVSNLNTIALPKIANKKINKINVFQKIIYFYILILLILFTYILLAPYLFKILFPQYLSAVIYSQVLALRMLFTPIGLINQIFLAKMRKKDLFLINSVFPTARIVLLLILLPLYGIWGAIIALLGATAINSMLSIFLFLRNKNFKYEPDNQVSL